MRGSERTWIVGMWIALFASVAVSTVLHHRHPEVLGVPPLDGIPLSDPLTMFVLDLLPIGLGGVCYVHAVRRHGHLLATLFLVGSFVFTGLEETLWILAGRFGAQGTYWFTRGFFWFLETPVSACIGWFFLAYATMWVAEIVFPKASRTAKATVAGLVAMDLDLWVDPVQTHRAFRSWVWVDQPGGLWILSIPVTNFIGWFLLIFLFALVFDRLPKWIETRGLGAAVGRFFGTLLALEGGILAFFLLYGTVEQTLLRPKWNLTVWGI